MASRPQRRTLVKALDRLVRQVNGSVFNSLSSKEINDSYKQLLLATNEAEKVLDRERQHSEREAEHG